MIQEYRKISNEVYDKVRGDIKDQVLSPGFADEGQLMIDRVRFMVLQWTSRSWN